MDKVALIACCSKKNPEGTTARTVYASSLFRKSLAWAELQQPKAIYVLSAMLGLVGIDDPMRPYDFKMPSSKRERQIWAIDIMQHLHLLHDVQYTHFIVLAGRLYRDLLVQHLPYHSVPLQGLGIGQQEQALKQWIEEASL